MQPGFCTYEELKDYISSTKSQILGSWEYRRSLDVRYILQRLTIRCSVSTLRISCYREKARKQGLLGLLTFESIIKYGIGKSKKYVKIQEWTVRLPRGRKPGFMHVVAEMPEKGGVNTLREADRIALVNKNWTQKS